MAKKWLNKGNHKRIDCGNCGGIQNGIGTMDHHPQICPNCKISCIWYYVTHENVVQIIPEYAPDPIKLFIDWCQTTLDELEMIELMVGFEEIGKNKPTE